MSTLSWNCRGLGTPWAIQFLRETVLQKRPNIVFLCETLCKHDLVEKVKNSLGFERAISVDVQGRSGGIALLWRNKEEVQLLSYSKNHKDVEVEIRNWSKYRLTGLYGEPDRAKRQETWNLIRSLKASSPLPWCLIGDMNNVTKQEDKRGGRPYPTWLVNGFQEVLDDCDLYDVELSGYPYTWERGRGTDSWVEIKLDRVVVDRKFMSMFNGVKLTNLEISTSDHCPIFFEPMEVSHIVFTRVFRFENVWLCEPMCMQIVEEVWYRKQGSSLQEKVKECSEILTVWGHEITGSFKSWINQCKSIMKRVKGRRDTYSMQKYQEASHKLNEIYNQQEVFWRQRSKQLWLSEGDQNSKFFHDAARTRRKTNQITTFLNEACQSIGWETGLKDTMVDYFMKLFVVSETEWNVMFEAVSRRISQTQNDILVAQVEPNEVKKALFSMHPDKSSCPNGFSPGFYQKFWSIISIDMVNLVQNFFTQGKLENHIGDVNIVLIPKKKNPVNMMDLRPISLCNVAYKVLGQRHVCIP